MHNSLELDYPEEKLDVVVFSDASSDATDDIVRSFDHDRVELMRIEGRVGRTECQNRVVETLDTEIVVFSDANSMYDTDAVRALVSKLTDDTGCVVGELRYPEAGTNVGGISFYRAYERFVQRARGRRVGREGQRRDLRGAAVVLRPAPRDSISDFAEPLAIRESGWRVRFASDAVARERARGDADSELGAKKRTTTRSWHSLSRFTGLLNPLRYGFYAVQLWSLLLWLSPVFLVTALASGLGLLYVDGGPVYAAAVVGASAYPVSLTATVALDRLGVAAPLVFQAGYYFAILNYSLLVGLWNFLRDENVVVWETDERAG